MPFICTYHAPVGRLLLTADEAGLTGLCFEEEKRFPPMQTADHSATARSLLDMAQQWLDVYFSGAAPTFSVPLHLTGTPFQREVWDILLTIPYGQTTTYGAIAQQLATRRGLPRMSAQAVGGAVGRNPVAIIVPCHRVIGADGHLTGYAGGMDKKLQLLRLEKANGFASNPADH